MIMKFVVFHLLENIGFKQVLICYTVNGQRRGLELDFIFIILLHKHIR